MTERLSFLKPIRNITVAAVISLTPAGVSYAEGLQDGNIERNRIEFQETPSNLADDSILEILDDLVETDYGKALAYSLFFYSTVRSLYNLSKGKELDTARKYKENLIASASLARFRGSALIIRPWAILTSVPVFLKLSCGLGRSAIDCTNYTMGL